MTASNEDYTWERYYKDLCLRQKKKNNALAVELGEKTQKCADYTFQLDRIVKSSYWKMLTPLRKLYGSMRGGNNENRAQGAVFDRQEPGQGDITWPDGERMSLYERRLMYYEDYYGHWMDNDPIERQYRDYRASGMTRVREASFITVSLKECVGIKPPFDIRISPPAWIIFTLKDGMLASGYAERLLAILAEHPDCVLAYPDEDYYYSLESGIRRIEPDFKPGWSPDTLDAFFYIGSMFVLRTEVAMRTNWLGSSDPYRNIYDLVLQVTDKCGASYRESRILHIPQVLYHINADRYAEDLKSKNINSYQTWKTVCTRLKQDLAENRLLFGNTAEYDEIKKKSLLRRNLNGGFVEGQDGKTRHIVYKSGNPLISVLILSRDHPEVLSRLLRSFTERTAYRNYEFVIVDNGSSDENRAKYEAVLAEDTAGHPYRYIYDPMDFNFSALCNIAANQADGEYLLFMNDDMEVIQRDWLEMMLGYASLPYAGAVGAKLLYADSDLIQHAGITSMEIGPSHKLVIFPDDRSYYYGKNVFNINVIGVTGACFMISGDKFIQSGGFNESFPVAYNDVEYCMRLVKSGLVNIQCNGAVLYHYESLTRGADEGDEDKWDRLLNEKKRLYQIHPEFFKSDPYYNPNLIGNDSNYLSNCDFGYNNNLSCEVVRQVDAGILAGSEGSDCKITIDFAGIRSKLNLEEPEFIEIRGWSFIPGQDNSKHTVNVILENTTNGIVYQIKSYAMPRKDLEATFPEEKNNRLCGFCARLLKDDLAAGTYRVGIEPTVLKEDLSGSDSRGIVIYTDAGFTV